MAPKDFAHLADDAMAIASTRTKIGAARMPAVRRGREREDAQKWCGGELIVSEEEKGEA